MRDKFITRNDLDLALSNRGVGDKLRNVLSYYTDNGATWKGSQLELNQYNTLPGYGGYIDFHYNGSTADYTSRIIEDASGKLSVYASNGLYINGIRLSELLKIQYQAVYIPANSSSVSVTAPTISGYKFICWLQPASQGWVGATYMQSPDLTTSNLWRVGNTESVARGVSCYSLYYKIF